mmetsp:Transcript_45918/g.74658  ORF Transcript_45918/g.74658 Transcript_45918/m.74658 type:complete len:251 (+) Transcript_45918:735-1487(+)
MSRQVDAQNASAVLLDKKPADFRPVRLFTHPAVQQHKGRLFCGCLSAHSEAAASGVGPRQTHLRKELLTSSLRHCLAQVVVEHHVLLVAQRRPSFDDAGACRSSSALSLQVGCLELFRSLAKDVRNAESIARGSEIRSVRLVKARQHNILMLRNGQERENAATTIVYEHNGQGNCPGTVGELLQCVDVVQASDITDDQRGRSTRSLAETRGGANHAVNPGSPPIGSRRVQRRHAAVVERLCKEVQVPDRH